MLANGDIRTAGRGGPAHEELTFSREIDTNQVCNVTIPSVGTKRRVLCKRIKCGGGPHKARVVQDGDGWSRVNQEQAGGEGRPECGHYSQGCHGWWFRLCTTPGHVVLKRW